MTSVRRMAIGAMLIVASIGNARDGLTAAIGGVQQPASQAATTDPQQQVERIRVYYDRIATLSRTLPQRDALPALLRGVMQLVDDRSTAATNAEEVRAALMPLAFYVNGWNLGTVVPEARAWPRPARRTVLLRGRYDLARHFTLSALISATAGTPVATVAGLYKELSDARGGSGFSFSDVAANQAGETFGLMAISSDAPRFRARIREGIGDEDLLLDVANLTDNLSEAELTRQFGGVGAPAYDAVIDDIQRRVSALPLFR